MVPQSCVASNITVTIVFYTLIYDIDKYSCLTNGRAWLISALVFAHDFPEAPIFLKWRLLSKQWTNWVGDMFDILWLKPACNYVRTSTWRPSNLELLNLHSNKDMQNGNETLTQVAQSNSLWRQSMNLFSSKPFTQGVTIHEYFVNKRFPWPVSAGCLTSLLWLCYFQIYEVEWSCHHVYVV